MKYLIQFAVGDPSADGHGMCDYFTVASNRDIGAVREIQKKAQNKLGFQLRSICQNYGDNTIQDFQVIALKDKLGIDLELYDGEFDSGRYYIYGTDQLLELWLDILKAIDEDLDIEDVTPNYPMMWDGPGYGMFQT